MQVTLSRVVEAARQRKAAVTAEAGGYIILLAVQRLAAQPRQLDAELIQLTAAGEILIEGSGRAPPGDTEAALRGLLATLVGLSHTAPPALRAAAERPATGGLAALESELTAALIPINHAASGRALARLFRETEKALRGSTSSLAAPSSSQSSAAVSPSGPGPLVAMTPLPAPVAAPEPVSSSVSEPPGASSVQADAASLEIDVEVVSSDDEGGPAAQSSSAPTLVSAAPTAPVRSDAPQLIVEELDELDVQELDADEAAEEQALAPVAAAKPVGSAAPAELGRADELFAEAQEVADDLDVLLAAELPPPLPPVQTCVDVLASPRPEALPALVTETEPPPHRSDLRTLLDGFLAHTRCEEDMTANLRRIIGLEPWRTGTGPKMGPPEARGAP